MKKYRFTGTVRQDGDKKVLRIVSRKLNKIRDIELRSELPLETQAFQYAVRCIDKDVTVHFYCPDKVEIVTFGDYSLISRRNNMYFKSIKMAYM